MVRILYFQDSHIRGNNSCNRKDDYPNALRTKFQEITQLITNKIDCVICGGDLFNSPDVSKAIISEYIKIFRQWRVSFFTVVGSHDYLGYQPKTIPRTALGVLEAAGVVYILDKEKGYNLGDKIVIKGVHHSYNLDSDPKNYFVRKDNKNCILIEVVHGMVVDKPFFDEYTLIKDIKTEADLVLCSHYHPGWKPQKINNTLFLNPGSLGRTENIERLYLPSVIILDIGEKISYEIVPLKCATPSEDIFKTVTKLGSEMSEKILEFMKTLSNKTGNLERQDAKSLVLKIAKEEKVSERVIEEAINIIDEAMFNE